MTESAKTEIQAWTELIAVACTARKRKHPCRADQMYDASNLFVLCKKQVHSEGRPWIIVSSEHGLIMPETVIEPYEEDINTWNEQRLREWHRELSEQAQAIVAKRKIRRVLTLAGHGV